VIFPTFWRRKTSKSAKRGYLISAVKNIEITADGIKLVLVNTLAPVQIKEISSDAEVKPRSSFPLGGMWANH